MPFIPRLKSLGFSGIAYKKNFDFAKNRLKEIMNMPPIEQAEYIKNNPQEVNNLCQSWRDLASDDTDPEQRVAYIIDTGEDGYSKHRGPLRLLEIDCGKHSARTFANLVGSTENLPLLRTAYETGKVSSYDDGLPELEEEIPSQKSEEFTDKKSFEAERMKAGAKPF
jgi:hypothetical protein